MTTRRTRGISLLLFFFFLIHVLDVDARLLNGVPESARWHRRRALQRWKRNLTTRRRTQRRTQRRKRQEGSRLTWRFPTTERVSRIYSTTTATDGGTTTLFNHPTPGWTSPCIHVKVEKEKEERRRKDDDESLAATVKQFTLEAATRRENDESRQVVVQESKEITDEQWWPPLNKATEEESTKNKNNSWQTFCLRQRLGYGKECYQAVRDAALRWEFRSVQQKDEQTRPCGILRVRRQHTDNNSDDWTTSSAQQIWQGPGFPQPPLVTYTRTFLPFVYVMNPVHVVYSIVDQQVERNANGLFSSTAYATGAKHWLTGEERVTVILRDNQAVDVEICSVSCKSSRWGAALASQVRKLQHGFFAAQMNNLYRVATQAEQQEQRERLLRLPTMTTFDTAVEAILKGSAGVVELPVLMNGQ